MPDAPAVLASLWQVSWHAAVVAGLVLVARLAVGRAVPGRWRHALWAVVLCRLVMPIAPPSRASVFNLWHPAGPTQQVSSIVLRSAAAPPRIRPVVNDPDVIISPPPRTMPAPSPRASCWPAVATGAWLAVAAWLIGRLVVATVRFERQLARTSRPAGAELAAAFGDSCRQIRAGRRAALVVTDAVASPAVCGVLRPRVLVPTSLAESLTGGRGRLVFLHELAHVRCHDVAVDWAWAVVRAVHWFNPLVWLVNPIRRHDRELARDEMVLSIIGPAGTEAYGRTLLDLARPARPLPMCPGLIGMIGGDGGRLRQRVEAVARFRGRRRAVAVGVGVLLLTVAAVCLLTVPPSRTPQRVAVTTSPAIAAAGPATMPADDFVPTPDPADAVSPVMAETLAKLDRRLPEARFSANALSDVIDFLRDTTGLNIYVDWKALEAAGVRRTSPVTARLRDIKVGKVLELIFKSVEGDDDAHRLGYTVDQGVVTISTRRELNKNVVTRRYDIGDLLFVPPDYDVNGKAMPAAPRADRVAEVVQYIKQNVDPNSWRADDGRDDPDRPGRITSTPLRTILLVTATPESQRKVRLVLDSLRRSQALQVSVETRVVTVEDADFGRLPADVQGLLRPTSVPLPGTRWLYGNDVNTIAAARLVTSVAAPRLTLFSGQRSVASVTADQSYISAYTAVARPAAATAYEPILRTATTGLTLIVQATVSLDRRYVFIDLHPTVSRLAGLVAEPWAGAPAAGLVQRPVVVTSTIGTACSIPDEGTLLVSCGGFAPSATEPAVRDPAVAAGVDRARRAHVFLLVRPTILVASTQRRFPLLGEQVP